MGTRADFYIGNGKDSTYLGSIGWDGDPDSVLGEIDAETQQEYQELVLKLIEENEGTIAKKDGWPWPWSDSSSTDYSYSFFDGVIWYSFFGSNWQDKYGRSVPNKGFPDMSRIQNVTLDPNKSGLLLAVPSHDMKELTLRIKKDTYDWLLTISQSTGESIEEVIQLILERERKGSHYEDESPVEEDCNCGC